MYFWCTIVHIRPEVQRTGIFCRERFGPPPLNISHFLQAISKRKPFSPLKQRDATQCKMFCKRFSGYRYIRDTDRNSYEIDGCTKCARWHRAAAAQGSRARRAARAYCNIDTLSAFGRDSSTEREWTLCDSIVRPVAIKKSSSSSAPAATALRAACSAVSGWPRSCGFALKRHLLASVGKAPSMWHNFRATRKQDALPSLAKKRTANTDKKNSLQKLREPARHTKQGDRQGSSQRTGVSGGGERSGHSEAGKAHQNHVFSSSPD